MSRYTKEQTEDVARIFAKYSRGLHDGVVGDFADLFAADNPQRCSQHGGLCGKHHEDCNVVGFDRKQFLEACGLEPARPYSTSMLQPSEGPPYPAEGEPDVH